MMQLLANMLDRQAKSEDIRGQGADTLRAVSLWPEVGSRSENN